MSLFQRKESLAPELDSRRSFWLVDGTSEYRAYVKGAKKAGRGFPAPGRVRVQPPPVFDSAVSWGEDLVGDAIEDFFQRNREDFLFVAEHQPIAQRFDDTAVSSDDIEAEDRRRVVGEVFRRRMALRVSAHAFDAGLERLNGAMGRLLGDMKDAFARCWFYREHLHRVDFPVFDARAIAYRNRAGMDIPTLLADELPDGRQAPPPRPPQLRAIEGDGGEPDEGDDGTGVVS